MTWTRKLGALVTVEYLRCPSHESPLERFNAEIGFQSDTYVECQDIPAVPVNNGHQIDEAGLESDICDIGTPDLIDPFNCDPAQQIGVNIVARSRTAQVGAGKDSHQPH